MIPLTFFKTKSALEIKPILPKADEQFPKAGGLFLKFATALPEGGEHKFDWANATTMFLAASEITTFTGMLAEGSGKIFHDPDKGKENEGTRAKTLSVNKGDSATFVNLSVGDKKYSTTLSKAEITTLTTTAHGILPKLFNW